VTIRCGRAGYFLDPPPSRTIFDYCADVLLRDMENREARLPEDERFDYGRIRSTLGLGA
jgi:hypothetical protein